MRAHSARQTRATLTAHLVPLLTERVWPATLSAKPTSFFWSKSSLRLQHEGKAMNIQSNLHMDKPAFLSWVQGREERYELAEGCVTMMTGGTMSHGLIVRNVFAMLDRELDRRTWAVLTEFGVDVGPRTIRYPDVVVDRRGAKPKDRTAKAPAFVVEVLSPSTATIDLGDKAAEYLQLSSLVAYLVLSQDEIKGWIYFRDALPGGPKIVAGEQEAIRVPTLGISLPLSEVYADVEFDQTSQDHIGSDT